MFDLSVLLISSLFNIGIANFMSKKYRIVHMKYFVILRTVYMKTE